MVLLTITITITITITMTIHSNLHTYILIYIYSRVCVGGDDIFMVLGACDLYLELIVESDLSVLNAS
jgi:hypothetical protein